VYDQKKNLLKSSQIDRTSQLISIKLSTNHPWAKGIQVCSSKGPSPLQGRDVITKKAKNW
jgi:hypothetical protein